MATGLARFLRLSSTFCSYASPKWTSTMWFLGLGRPRLEKGLSFLSRRLKRFYFFFPFLYQIVVEYQDECIWNNSAASVNTVTNQSVLAELDLVASLFSLFAREN